MCIVMPSFGDIEQHDFELLIFSDSHFACELTRMLHGEPKFNHQQMASKAG